MPSGEGSQASLRAFAERWAEYAGGERGEAQTFLNELFACYPVTDSHRARVAKASRRLLARRTEICAQENIGLTKRYNAVDEGAWTDLKALHRELVRMLTERNREIVEDGRPDDPFGSPGGAVGAGT